MGSHRSRSIQRAIISISTTATAVIRSPDSSIASLKAVFPVQEKQKLEQPSSKIYQPIPSSFRTKTRYPIHRTRSPCEDISLYKTLSSRHSRPRTSTYLFHVYSYLLDFHQAPSCLGHVTSPTSSRIRRSYWCSLRRRRRRERVPRTSSSVHDQPSAIPHAIGSVIMPKLGNETAKYALISTIVREVSFEHNIVGPP